MVMREWDKADCNRHEPLLCKQSFPMIAQDAKVTVAQIPSVSLNYSDWSK
jgi:hypothetical protein